MLNRVRVIVNWRRIAASRQLASQPKPETTICEWRSKIRYNSYNRRPPCMLDRKQFAHC